MKHIAKYLLLVALLPIFITSCQKDDDDEDTNNQTLPSGLYFQMKVNGTTYWAGKNLSVMRVTRQMNGAESKYYDFVAISNSESDSVLKNYLYLHVKVNDDGTFSNYVVRFFKNKHTYDTGFGEYYTYSSGAITVSDTTNGDVSAKFSGSLSNSIASTKQYVEISFQDFPLVVATNKKK